MQIRPTCFLYIRGSITLCMYVAYKRVIGLLYFLIDQNVVENIDFIAWTLFSQSSGPNAALIPPTVVVVVVLIGLHAAICNLLNSEACRAAEQLISFVLAS